MKNNTFEEIGSVLERADNILIFPHLNMDGDAMGSSAALCRMLRNMGKNCWIMLNDGDVADNLTFMDKGYCTCDPMTVPAPELAVTVDCSEPKRFPEVGWKYEQAPVKISIDHHMIQETASDYNYIDPSSCATGELIWLLIKAMGQPADREIAEDIFAAITTDSGNFQYSNTTKRTHEIVAELFDCGLDCNRVSTALYECVRPEKLRLKSRVLSAVDLFGDGKLAMARVNQALLKETGAGMSDAEGIVAELRSLKGVEIAAFLKEGEEGEVYVSLRAKGSADVQKIAASFGGGGHVKAAGCTLHGAKLNEVYEQVKQAALLALEAQEGRS